MNILDKDFNKEIPKEMTNYETKVIRVFAIVGVVISTISATLLILTIFGFFD